MDNSGFQVERSEDGQQWTAIGWVDGHNNSTVQRHYTYEDYEVSPNVRYYYRLKQVDNDGDYEYTGTVTAMITEREVFTVMDFVPNPANHSTSLVVTTGAAQAISIELYNAVGQRVIDRKEELHKGGNRIEVNLTDIAAGAYTAIVRSSGKTYSKKLIVVK